MKRGSVLWMVEIAILTAIIILMSFTAIGYLKIGIFEIALVTIPVVVGAMVTGPMGGLTLGIVFGATSFMQCFGMSAFGTVLCEVNPLFAFFMCVPTRALMGWLTGIIFRGLRNVDKTKTFCYYLSGLLGALLNTVFFMGVLVLCFWNTDYIQGLAGGKGIFGFLVAMVGVNGLVEMAACAIIGGTVSKVLNMIIKKTSDGKYV